MSATIIFNEAPSQASAARPSGDDLWVNEAELRTATGWEIKPEGICRDEICIPVPAGRDASLLREEGGQTWLNLAEFARYGDQPVAHDEAGAVWYFGAPAAERRNALLQLEAPDFTLPDLGGELHSLAALRGKKVLLLLWSSW